MNDLTPPAIVREQEQTIETCLHDYCSHKEDLKTLKRERTKMMKEAMRTDAVIEIKRKIKELKEVLKGEEIDIEVELNDNEDYDKLRRLILEVDEKRAQTKAVLMEKVAKLPAEQMAFQFGPIRATVQTEKALYINGKKE